MLRDIIEIQEQAKDWNLTNITELPDLVLDAFKRILMLAEKLEREHNGRS